MKTNYARIDAKELPNLLREIEVYRGTHVTRLAMKLMALTFVRTSELIGSKWCESISSGDGSDFVDGDGCGGCIR